MNSNELHWRDKESLGIELSESDTKTKIFLQTRENAEQLSPEQVIYLSKYFQSAFLRKKREEFDKRVEDALAKGESPPDRKEYVDITTGKLAYQYLLENDSNKDEAMEYAAKMEDKPEGWVKKVKHSPFQHSRDIMNEFKEHPMQVAITKSDLTDTKGLRKSNTWNKLMTGAETSKAIIMLQHEHKIMKQMLYEHSLQISALQQENIDTKDRVGSVEDELEDIRKILDTEEPKMQKGLKLRSLGYTQKQVAEILKVTTRSVKSWDKKAKTSPSTSP